MLLNEKTKIGQTGLQCLLLIVAVSVTAGLLHPALAAAQGFSCLEPEEPYAYHLDKSDPLYQTARDEFQTYLEEMERYLLCLEQERAGAFIA